MSKKLNSYFIFLFILVITYQQNIITSWNYDKVLMYMMNDFQVFINNQLNNETIIVKEIHEENYTLTNITKNLITCSLYDSYGDLLNDKYLLGDYKITFNYNFTYNDIQKKESIDCSFDLVIKSIKIKTFFNNQTLISSSNVTILFLEDNFHIYGLDKETMENVKKSLYNGFVQQNIAKQYEDKMDIIKLYNDIYSKKKNINFITSESLGSKNITVKIDRFITFCKDIERKIENALCYYSGEIGESELVDKRDVPLYNKDFIQAGDNYNVFINKDLIEQIFSQTEKNKINIKKNIDKFEKIFNDEEFNINSDFYYVINKFSYSLNKFDISIFKKNENKISSINLKFNTKYEVSIIGNTKINICISDLKLIDIQGKNINISYIKDFIVTYSKENKICLSDKGISLRDIYTYMTSIQSDDNGVFISGQQLYQ